MVIDTSALTAIFCREPEREAFFEAVNRDPVRLISALTVLEAGMVLEARQGAGAVHDLELFLHTLEAEVVPFDARHADLAIRAWRRFGKGNHPAALNLGDCCVYALAQATGEPILCKGNDFSRTDAVVVP